MRQPPRPAQKSPQFHRNEKGQVALFIALIFQVLFVFFAMMINVGLLVHHKINLQNSVDLAAYYAASKQAETLNAMAHVNYQMRQSWKLLNFRVKQLGSFGAQDGTYFYPGKLPGDNNVPDDKPTNLVPGFCIDYPWFKSVGDDTSYCNQSGNKSKAAGDILTITHPTAPVSSNYKLDQVAVLDKGIVNFFQRIDEAFKKVAGALADQCEFAVGVNYFALARFIWGYKQDISTRKRLFLSLAENMSASDPIDLDGATYSTGISKTIIKNLTYENKASLQSVQFYNSLSDPSCANPVPPAAMGYSAPAWVSEINIYPQFFPELGVCSSQMTELSLVRFDSPDSDPRIAQAVASPTNPFQQINAWLDIYAHENLTNKTYYNTSLGFEKNPNCMAYVGVQAQAQPNIPFSPFGAITIKAVAYAKPFGGTIGPWFAGHWTGGDHTGETPPTGYPMNVKRWVVGSAIPNDSPDASKSVEIDYPRYTGDTVGAKSLRMQYAFGKTISTLFPKTPSQNRMDLSWWDTLLNQNYKIEDLNGDGDALAYSDTDPRAKLMRNLEISVVAPDEYDIANYSIEPDFYNNYLMRMTNNGSNRAPSWLKQLEGQYPIRGDLGARANDGTLKSFSVKDQIQTLVSSEFNKYVGSGGPLNFYVQNNSSYNAETLTGFKNWVSGSSPVDPTTYFGKCAKAVGSSDAFSATTGNCIAGGRVGYSVKLVDYDIVSGNKQIPYLTGVNDSNPGTIVNTMQNASWQPAPTK